MKQNTDKYLWALRSAIYGDEDLGFGGVYDYSEAERLQIHLVEIEMKSNMVRYIIWLSRPGFLIGRGGAKIDALRWKLKDILQVEVWIDIKEFDPFWPRYYRSQITIPMRIKFAQRWKKFKLWIQEQLNNER